MFLEEKEDEGTFTLSFSFPEQWYPKVQGYNRFWAAVVGETSEHIYGGGEQYTYLDLKSRNYPMWVREQGVGRNKSDIVTNIMDALYHAGGDYYTTYWPQVTTLSLFLFSKISNCLSGLIFVLKKILSGVLFLWLP